MKTYDQIKAMSHRINNEVDELRDDLNEEDTGILALQDCLAWVLGAQGPDSLLDGYFRER